MPDINLTLTAAICTFNRSKYLKRALNSFLFQSAGTNQYEILIVDNNSTDETKSIVDKYRKRLKNLHYLFEPQQGLSFARNAALSYSKKDIVAFIDDDAVAHPNWVENIIKAFQDDQSIVVSGGNIAIIWETKRPDWLDDFFLSYYGHLNKGLKARFLPKNDFVYGGNIAFKSAALKNQFFNTKLGMIGNKSGASEEIEIQMRLCDQGYRIFFDPAIKVFHFARKDAMTIPWIKKRIISQQQPLYQTIIKSDERVLINHEVILSIIMNLCRLLLTGITGKPNKQYLKSYFDLKTMYFKIKYHGVWFPKIHFQQIKSSIRKKLVYLIQNRSFNQTPKAEVTDLNRFGYIDLVNNQELKTLIEDIITELCNFQVQILGWAFDADTMRKADAVYVCVGEKEFKSDYGQARPDVAKHFNAPGIEFCGFNCTLPANAFIEGMNEISLKVVSDKKVFEGVAQTSIGISHLSEKFSFYKKLLNESIRESGILRFPVYPEPKVSIVIFASDSWAYTHSCVQSVINNSNGISHEAILITNRNDEDKSGQIENCLKIIVGADLNYSGAANRAAGIARGEFLVFLDGTACVQPDWLGALLDIFNERPQIGMVGSKIIYSDGLLAGAGRIALPTGEIADIGENYPSEHYALNYVKEAPFLQDRLFIIRKSLFISLNGFQDEGDDLSAAFIKLTSRIRGSGLKLLYQPRSEAIIEKGVRSKVVVKDEIGEDLFSTTQEFQHDGFAKLNSVADHYFFTRDCSRPGKIILYVDHCTPRIDQDGASFITFQYFKAIQALGYKIILWPQDLMFIEPYTGILQQMGIEVVYGDVSFSEFITANGKYINFAFLAQPGGSLGYLEMIRKHSAAKILYMAHDLHFLRQMREKAVSNTCDNITIEQTRQMELELMHKSDVSLFFSEKEIDYLDENYPEITARYIPWIQEIRNPSDEFHFENKEGLLFVGAFGHMPNYDGIKWFHDEIFPEIVKVIPEINIVVLGSYPPDDILSFSDENFLVTGYVKDIDHIFSKARVFISPLRFGAGFKTKNARAMSHALPMVTTTIGAEGMNLTEGHNVLIANDAITFAHQVIELYTNPTLWKILAANSKAHVADNYSFENAQNFLSQKLLM